MVVRMRLSQRWLRNPAGMLAQRWLWSPAETLAQRWLRSSPEVLVQRWLPSPPETLAQRWLRSPLILLSPGSPLPVDSSKAKRPVDLNRILLEGKDLPAPPLGGQEVAIAGRRGADNSLQTLVEEAEAVLEQLQRRQPLQLRPLLQSRWTQLARGVTPPETAEEEVAPFLLPRRRAQGILPPQ